MHTNLSKMVLHKNYEKCQKSSKSVKMASFRGVQKTTKSVKMASFWVDLGHSQGLFLGQISLISYTIQQETTVKHNWANTSWPCCESQGLTTGHGPIRVGKAAITGAILANRGHFQWSNQSNQVGYSFILGCKTNINLTYAQPEFYLLGLRNYKIDESHNGQRPYIIHLQNPF